ncbi:MULTISPECIES: thiamine phosphate synthase [Desulfitobacterium]|uniref:Thiamine-phosphate synthase n=1 Tax=Desulfitobacterium dehalogenans (strain ATCC 51507 / DSM 9161 / JW/IU-DC1) TaxID=756499 RepID=I4A8W2_DESDJ|nr:MULTISPECIES: thiamine phosphate synthase [Desulfitobacterium]AFM00397.1 thiamine-phosphate diphosphorylase [Desulfitobacterium dehalogenans ATCC 51507]
MAVDYSLYLVTDRILVGSKDFLLSLRKALEGGVTLLQLREKEANSRDFYEIGLKVKEMAAEFRVPLIINDRVDLALALDADGVHIGQKDLPIEVVRNMIGSDKILGYSVSSLEEALWGERLGADYLGAGPVFPTGSKKDASEAIGLATLKKIKDSVNLPVVGIGGIGPANLKEVKETGIDGISIISAILSQEDPYAAAKGLGDLWKSREINEY